VRRMAILSAIPALVLARNGAAVHPKSSSSPRPVGRCVLALTAVGLIGASVLQPVTASAGVPPVNPSAPGPYRVASVDYTLGDSALKVPGFRQEPGSDEEQDEQPLAPIELTGTAHYPQDLSGKRHPLIVLSHGYWITCADAAAKAAAEAAEEERATIVDPTPPEEGEPTPVPEPGQTDDPARWHELSEIITSSYGRLTAWPCATGTPALPSYRGFDYLAKHLASQGFIVVSVSANGVNAGSLGETADMARAAVVNKHLAMWAQLDRTGSGPLATRFTRPRSTTPVKVDFKGRIDLTQVGTMGHSRGGRGAIWQAADVHRDLWPAGVQVKAVVALAPANAYGEVGSQDAVPYLVTRTPFMVWLGTCDGGTGVQGQGFLKFALGRNRVPMTQLTVHGANHNFVNTEWSPSSGQVDAQDDASHSGPGRCEGRTPGTLPTKPDGTFDPDAEDGIADEDVAQLGEAAERKVSAAYLSAYFRRNLMNDKRFDSMLSGKQFPLARIADVEALRIDPARR
jgi:hypothetical protein